MVTLSAKLPDSIASPRQSMFTDQEIERIASQGKSYIAEWAKTIAAERDVEVRPLPSDTFVRAVSRLSDGIVDLDPIEYLLVALARAGVLTAYQSSLLHANYLD